MENSGYLFRLWQDAKTWRSLRLGPINLNLRFSRAHRRPPRFPPWRRHECGLSPGERPQSKPAPEVAVIAGMGAEIGPALVRKCSRERMRVAVLSRSAFHSSGEDGLRSYSCDLTDSRETKKAFADIAHGLGDPSLFVYGVQGWHPGSFLDTQAAAFEDAWRANCLGAFIAAQQAARSMINAGRGTIVFLGSTSGTVGRLGYLNLAVGKFGLRALAQVMARELAPRGIHVVHVVIDADVRSGHCDGEPRSSPDELAELIWSLHNQPRSVWTHELDVRPHDEEFWQHC